MMRQNLIGAIAILLDCCPVLAQEPPTVVGPAWYIYQIDFDARFQFPRCDEYAQAGNLDTANLCRTYLKNAADYLHAKASNGSITFESWILCQGVMETDVELGARCITAVLNTCPSQPMSRDDYVKCANMVEHGNFILNPQAQRLDFSRPIPTQKVGR